MTKISSFGKHCFWWLWRITNTLYHGLPLFSFTYKSYSHFVEPVVYHMLIMIRMILYNANDNFKNMIHYNKGSFLFSHTMYMDWFKTDTIVFFYITSPV